MNRLDKMEALLEQCEQDLEKLQDIRRSLKTIENNRQQLAAYYHSYYPKDYDENVNANYRILDQDSIWNTLTDQQHEKIKLLKTLIKDI